MKSQLKLLDIFNRDVWQKIQDSFAKATGFAAIIVDKHGIPLLHYSNFTDYCLEVRETNRCANCFLSDAMGGNIAAQAKKPVIYRCHGGLIDFAVPITVKGEYMGAILAGQARISEEEMEENNIAKLPDEEDVTPLYEYSDKMKEKFEEINITSFERIKAASDLLYTLANSLAEMKLVNLMQGELHEKEIELSEETRLRSEVEAALKEADLKALQSQLNPHFLFNVLNTIGRLALLEKADKTQELVYQFSDLMRYSLQKNNAELVTIADEIEYVNNYLSIQKVRLGNRLNYEVDLEAGVEKVRCPSMIIQPFVENVINHVIEPNSSGGELKVSAKEKGDEVQIIITDNGAGIPRNKAKEILKGTYVSEGKSTGLGIVNVNKRLKYYFGPDHGVKIGSSKGGGTKITMRIPKIPVEV